MWPENNLTITLELQNDPLADHWHQPNRIAKHKSTVSPVGYAKPDTKQVHEILIHFSCSNLSMNIEILKVKEYKVVWSGNNYPGQSSLINSAQYPECILTLSQLPKCISKYRKLADVSNGA